MNRKGRTETGKVPGSGRSKQSYILTYSLLFGHTKSRRSLSVPCPVSIRGHSDASTCTDTHRNTFKPMVHDPFSYQNTN